MNNTIQTVVPRWEFKPGDAVLVRYNADIETGTIAPSGTRVRLEVADGTALAVLLFSRTVPRTTAGIHELRRQLACLEGEIAATRNRLDEIYRECAEVEGL